MAGKSDIATIDGSGRLVVPRHLRETLGLCKGLRLRLIADGNRLILEPLPEHHVPVDEGGLLVATGALIGPIPDHREVRQERVDRLSRVEPA
jgi:bifunctional DNA-binding transcriptional regulator/antitoxin component of YhaV-PrlF toxin-antitoxin module